MMTLLHQSDLDDGSCLLSVVDSERRIEPRVTAVIGRAPAFENGEPDPRQ